MTVELGRKAGDYARRLFLKFVSLVLFVCADCAGLCLGSSAFIDHCSRDAAGKFYETTPTIAFFEEYSSHVTQPHGINRKEPILLVPVFFFSSSEASPLCVRVCVPAQKLRTVPVSLRQSETRYVLDYALHNFIGDRESVRKPETGQFASAEP